MFGVFFATFQLPSNFFLSSFHLLFAGPSAGGRFLCFLRKFPEFGALSEDNLS